MDGVRAAVRRRVACCAPRAFTACRRGVSSLNGIVPRPGRMWVAEETHRTSATSTFQVKQTAGSYPQLSVDTTTSPAVGQAGGGLMSETIAVSGLGREWSAALSRWRKRLPIHDPAKVITDRAMTPALGGDAMADTALLRAEPGVYGRVASDATVSGGPSTLMLRTPRLR